MRELVSIMVNGTGYGFKKSHIIEIRCAKCNNEDFIPYDNKSWLIKPDIDAADWDINNINNKSISNDFTKEFIISHGKSLIDVADEIINYIGDCDILTYDGNVYDLKLLNTNFLKIGKYIDFIHRNIYDIKDVENQVFKHDYAALFKKYINPAEENVVINPETIIKIFSKQLSKNPEHDILNNCKNNLLSLTNQVISDNNRLYFTVGKYYGFDVLDICRNDPSYIIWFIKSAADPLTRLAIKKYYNANKI